MIGPSTSPNRTRGRRRSWGRNPLPIIRTSPPGNAAAGVTASMCGWPLALFLPKMRLEMVMQNYGKKSRKRRTSCITNCAYSPAAMSSMTMPVPSGNRSSWRTGGGFRISKARKRIKPTSSVLHETGTNSIVIHWPATSSITTDGGSFTCKALANRVAAGIPVAIVSNARPTNTTHWKGTGVHRATIAQIRSAAADPQVPGPGRSRPAPKNVASVDQSGAVLTAGVLSAVTSLIFILPGTGMLEQVTDVLHRRGYYVLSTGPFAKID